MKGFQDSVAGYDPITAADCRDGDYIAATWTLSPLRVRNVKHFPGHVTFNLEGSANKQLIAVPDEIPMLRKRGEDVT